MSTFNTLKLVASKKHASVSPLIHRSNKLVTKLHEQIELCVAKKAGLNYAPKKLKTYTNKQTGERMTVEVAKRIREWWFRNDAGKVGVSVRYGTKVIELAKGKHSVEVENALALVKALETIKSAVEQGELDTQIEAASGALKLGFKK